MVLVVRCRERILMSVCIVDCVVAVVVVVVAAAAAGVDDIIVVVFFHCVLAAWSQR